MQFKIEPYIGAGKIKLGMTSQQISDKLMTLPSRFKKFDDDQYDTDVYEMCFIYYKDPGVCEAIEFFKPATVVFNELDLLTATYDEVKSLFSKLDMNVEFDETGLTSIKYGIGIYAPFANTESNRSAEGVIVFEKGYY